MLLDDGIITPLRVFHARVIDNAQDRPITKATVEPQLEHAAACIAAVVEAERPANRPTLKGLIHDDVDKTTEELYRRIQSLEAKLGETKNALKRKTATSGDTFALWGNDGGRFDCSWAESNGVFNPYLGLKPSHR